MHRQYEFMVSGVLKSVYILPFLSSVCTLTSFKGWYLNVEPYKTEITIGQQMCINACKSEGRCCSINFDRRFLSCEFYQDCNSSSKIADQTKSYFLLSKEDKKCHSVQCGLCDKCVDRKKKANICMKIRVEDSSQVDYIGNQATYTWSSALYDNYYDYDYDHGYYDYELYRDPILGSEGAWCSDKLDGNQYLQYDFQTKKTFVAVKTAGLDIDEYVTSYSILYRDSTDDNWEYVRSNIWDIAVFEVPYAGNILVLNVFDCPVKGRSLRLLPIHWNYHICVSMDILGY